MDPFINGKNITICVTGGIAAYKAVHLASFLKKKGGCVRVILSKNGSKFVTPITFKSITRNPVITNMFDESNFIPHISIAELTDILIVAPATANIIAKAACGIADDMISATILSTLSPKIIVPSMNTAMYENPVTQRNLSILKGYGFYVMEPDSGELACGTTGKGRFPDIERIYGFMVKSLAKKDTVFTGRKILITAGGTVEDIDPVRFISNRSSGKTAFSFAEEFIKCGGDIKIIVGNVDERVLSAFTDKYGFSHIVRVRNAKEMKNQVDSNMEWADILFMCAAVADYKPEYSSMKIKKNADDLTIRLNRTEDILSSVKRDDKKIVIGFAAETDNIVEYAKNKLDKKKLDFVIANSVSGEKIAIGGDRSELLLFSKWDNGFTTIEYDLKCNNSSKVLSIISDTLIKNGFTF